MMSGELNRHGGTWAEGATPAEERESERADAVQERAREILEANRPTCPECENAVATWAVYSYHGATCELLRARAEAEVDRG